METRVVLGPFQRRHSETAVARRHVLAKQFRCQPRCLHGIVQPDGEPSRLGGSVGALSRYLNAERAALDFQYEYRVASLTSQERLRRPTTGQNSVAWVTWHMFRNEDALVNAIFQEQPQVLDDGWRARIGINDEAIGTGYTSEQVQTFGERADSDQLDSYCRAVSLSTSSWLAATDEHDLDRIPAVDSILGESPSILSPESGWVPHVWRDKTLAQMYAYFVVGHGYMHYGEIEDIRSGLGLPGL